MALAKTHCSWEKSKFKLSTETGDKTVLGSEMYTSIKGLLTLEKEWETPNQVQSTDIRWKSDATKRRRKKAEKSLSGHRHKGYG